VIGIGARGTAAPASGSGSSVGALLEELEGVLAAAGVSEARREAADIVAAATDRPRFWPTTHREEILQESRASAARAAARRRAAGAPFAYAVGQAAFRHLTLGVDERVLVPRQETEVLVDVILAECASRRGGIAVDIGTGSGAIALALASEGSFDRVIATDVSAGALAVASANARRLGTALRAPVEFRAGMLVEPLRGARVRVVASNPPYIAHGEAFALPRSVRDWEPPVALYSGETGMAATAAIVAAAPDVLEPGGLLALEVDARRASLAAELALADGRYRDVAVRLDLAGRERILLARRGDE